MKSQITKLLSVFACLCLLLTAIIIPASAAETSATITFDAAKANRTEYSSTIQVWEQNGITVTNNKGASTSEVGDYSAPARFYKSSDVTIEYPGMTKIEIDVTGVPAKNQNAWVNSCTVGNATLSGNVVTITLDAAADSYSIKLTDNQARANSITVYAAAAEEPEECKHIGGYASSNGDETHNIVCDSCEEVLQTAVACTDADADGKCDECLGTVALPDDGDNGDDTPAATEITLTVNSLGLASQSYSASTATVDGVDFEWEQLGNYGNGIQVRDNPEKGTSIFWNTTAFGAPIKEIKLVFNSAKSTYDNPNAEIFSFGNAAGTYDYSTELSTVKGTKEYTITPNAETYTFLKFEHNINYTFYWDSITIVLAGDDTTGGTTPDEPDTPVVPDEPDEPVTPVEPENKTIAEVLAMADGDTLFYVTAEIVDTYRDTWATYGNFILKDDSTEDTIIMYGLNDQDGNRYDKMATKPVVGDTVKVLAKRSSYNGVGQLASAVLIELTPGKTPETPETPDTPDTPDTPVEPENPIAAPVAGTAYNFGMIQGNVSATDVYYIDGAMNGYYMNTTKDVAAAANVYVEETTGGYYFYAIVDGAKKYINMVVSGTHVNGAFEDAASTVYTFDTTNGTLIADIDGASYWFGTRNDKSYTTVGPCNVEYNGFFCTFYPSSKVDTEPEEPDTPVVPDEPEDPSTPSIPAPDATNTLTIKEALELGAAQDTSSYTADKYYVTGKLTALTSDMYGNMYLADDEGNEILVYGTYGADGKDRYDALASKPDAGDTVTVYGIVGNFNGTPQLKNAWIIEFTAGELEEPEVKDPEADSALTVKEAIELALSKRHNVFTADKYYVTGKIIEIYNEDYGNMKIQDADGNILTIYGSFSEDGSLKYAEMETKPAVGDTITFYGIIGQYNGTAQMKNAWMSVPTTDDNTNEGETTTPDNDDTTGDNGTTSPVTGDNVGAIVALSMAAAAAIICTKKRR